MDLSASYHLLMEDLTLELRRKLAYKTQIDDQQRVFEECVKQLRALLRNQIEEHEILQSELENYLR